MSEGKIGGMTCREVTTLLPQFFDGELDSRHMRSVALHSTRCPGCETELRYLERTQQLVSETVSAAVDSIDLAGFWHTVEPQLGAVHVTVWQRLATWWSNQDHRWVIRVPAYAAATVAALFALLYVTQTLAPNGPFGTAQVVTMLDPSVWIDSLESDVDSVTVFSDPGTSTTVLWVNDELPSAEE